MVHFKAWMEYVLMTWAKNHVNVCAIDWKDLAAISFNYFLIAKRNAPRIAHYLADVFGKFAEDGLNLADTSLAGHSIGAHIFGMLGREMKRSRGSIGTIYGEITS